MVFFKFICSIKEPADFKSSSNSPPSSGVLICVVLLSKCSITQIIPSAYIGTVKLNDSLTGDHSYILEEHHPAIITEYDFRCVQDAKRNRSNIVTDETGTHRKSTKYSSKKK